MKIISFNEFSEELKCLSIPNKKINDHEELIVQNLVEQRVGTGDNRKYVFQFELNNKMYFIYINEDTYENKNKYTSNVEEIDILKDKEFSGSYGVLIEEIEIIEFDDLEKIVSIDTDQIMAHEGQWIIERLNEKFESKNIRDLLVKHIENFISDFDFSIETEDNPHVTPLSDKCIFLDKGIFNLYTGKVEEDVLFMLNTTRFTKDSVIFTNGKSYSLTDSCTLLLISYSDDTWDTITLGDMQYMPVVFQKLDNDHYLGYKEDSEDTDFTVMYTRKEKNEFTHTYHKLQIIENQDTLEIQEQEYENEYKTIFKKKLNSSGDMITICDKTFEYDSKIKDKIIDQWNSIIWDFVLLEDGKLWGYTKEWDSITNEVLLEENCTHMDFIIGWNNSVTILKTNNNVHYFPRYETINKNEVVKYHYKDALTDDIKNNSLVKIPYTSKYSKANKLWSIQLLPPLQVILDDNDEAILENNSTEYALYDYEKGFVHMSIGERKMLIVLDQEYINMKNYDGTIIFNTEKTKRWTGMNKWTMKENGNYFIVRNKNKKRVLVFVEWNDNTDQYGIDKGKYFIKQGSYFLGDGKFCGKDTKFFDDKNLPDKMFVEGDSIRSIILPEDWDNEKGGSYTEIITPEDKYGQSSIARKKS